MLNNLMIIDDIRIQLIKEQQVSREILQSFFNKQSAMKSQQQDPRCKYTLFPIENQEHREKLDKFIKTRGKIKEKGSLCRFYLRGICIMKPQYCKFAHSVKQLNIDSEQGLFYMTLSEKERRKRQFTEKKQFNQTALFILKNVKYYVLYDYQFSQRFKKSGLEVHDIDTISKDRSIRIRIREIMHRQTWDGFLDFLQAKFPDTNFPISFISFWYANFGFDKPQTRCKFGDFLKYSMFVRKYVQVDIVFPPNMTPTIYLVNSQKKGTILQKNIQQIYDRCMKQKQKESQQKMTEFLQMALPEQLSKKFICRYFMAGNCQQQSDKCLYAHSIEQLSQNYQLGQQFPVEYRQPVMPIQVRMNFTSLYEATRKYEQYATYSLQDINLNSTIRNELRHRVHQQLFSDFLKLIESLLQPENKPKDQQKFFSIQLKQLQSYYQGAGFNHTNQNKFQHLEGSLWDLGYYMEDKIIKDQLTLQKKKCPFVYKIPTIQYLDKIYRNLIKQCVDHQLKQLSQDNILLQSALKRTVYSSQKQQVLPLHVYLRYRKVTFQDIVTQFCQQHQINRIFFQSGVQNIKKLSQIVKKYVKKNRQYILKIDQVQSYIKMQKKGQVNLNHHYMNLRAVIQNVLVEMGKNIFFWPFDNNAYLIDLAHLQNYKKNFFDLQLKNMQKDESFGSFKDRCTNQQIDFFSKERIIVVDSLPTLQYSKKYLQKCAIMGVDLEGRLRLNGYVDLIQVSGVKRNENNQIQHKQIFIFDIWQMMGSVKQIEQKTNIQKKESQQTSEQKLPKIQGNQQAYTSVYKDCVSFIKNIFQNKNKVKILHDCRQDSVALKYILGISLQNVFDTSGFDIYLNEKNLYETEQKSNANSLLRKVYEVKVPGLNYILDEYKAPNGVNIFKESMKKKFGQPNSRSYFQLRPIDDQFLQYSARDVQDLIQVYQNMIHQDTFCLSYFIGKLYSTC